MDRPSDSWSDLASLDQDSEKYKRIQAILSSVNFRHLEKCGLEVRRKTHPALSPQMDCSVNTSRFNLGFCDLVLELSFTDHVCWIARIPYKTFNDDDRTSTLSEIVTMKIVHKHTKIPIPQVFHFEASADQAFGCPYMLLEYLGRQAGMHHMALWRLHLSIFYNQRQSENREALMAHTDDPDWLTVCWILKISLRQIILGDRVRGPFVMCHLDLHYGNMLFDQEDNLKGIIDWGNSQAAPLEQLSICPEFSIFPVLSNEQNRPARELKASVVRHLRVLKSAQETKMPLNNPFKNEVPDPDLTRLSDCLASKSSELALRQYVGSPGSLMDGKRMAKLLYGDTITWEQLKEVYDTMPLFQKISTLSI